MLKDIDMTVLNIFNMLSADIIPTLNKLLKDYGRIQILIAILAVLLLVAIILGVIIIRRQKRIEKLLKELSEARAGAEEENTNSDS